MTRFNAQICQGSFLINFQREIQQEQWTEQHWCFNTFFSLHSFAWSKKVLCQTYLWNRLGNLTSFLSSRNIHLTLFHKRTAELDIFPDPVWTLSLTWLKMKDQPSNFNTTKRKVTRVVEWFHEMWSHCSPYIRTPSTHSFTQRRPRVMTGRRGGWQGE